MTVKQNKNRFKLHKGQTVFNIVALKYGRVRRPVKRGAHYVTVVRSDGTPGLWGMSNVRKVA